MSKKIIQNIIIAAILTSLSIGLLSAFLGNKSHQSTQSEKINLALRRTAHLLLQQAGDSTSRIESIKNTDESVYSVKLEHHFNYDSLPDLLRNSFSVHGITERYDVEVWDCKNQELILGYTSADILNGIGVTCGGRTQPTLSCYNFKVIFPEISPILSQKPIVYILIGSVLTLIIGGFWYYFYIFLNKNTIVSTENLADNLTESSTESSTESILQQMDEKSTLRIGKSAFDIHNQVIFIENIPQKLTFREAKLLNLFCEHKNELLDRDFILKSVWEDEGVLVGRSVDVFVSRLRKILKEDDSLKITNVHGRGYRFEVE